MTDTFPIITTDIHTVAPLRYAWINHYLYTSGDDTIDDTDLTASQHYAIHHPEEGIIAIATLAHQPRRFPALHITAPHRLRWLGVHPRYRNEGHASRLIRHRLHLAQQAGSDYAWATSFLTSLPRYEHLGGISENEPYLDSGGVPHVRIIYPTSPRIESEPQRETE